MFQIKPSKVSDPTDGRIRDDYWSPSRRLLNEGNLIRRFLEYDKDHIPNNVIKKVQPYLNNVDFTPERVGRVSIACTAFCKWVHAMHAYHHIAKAVEPKRMKLHEAEEQIELLHLRYSTFCEHAAAELEK